MELSIKEFGVRKQVQIWLLPCPICVNTQVVQVSKLSAPVSRVLQWNKLRTQGRQSGNTHLGNADTANMRTSGERALPGSALTESHIPFFVPIGKHSTSWSFSFWAVKPHCTKQLHIPYHPSQARMVFYAGAQPANRSSWLLTLFSLESDQQSSNLNHNEVAAKAEREILSKRIPRESLESGIHSCWDTEASTVLKLR